MIPRLTLTAKVPSMKRMDIDAMYDYILTLAQEMGLEEVGISIDVNEISYSWGKARAKN